MRVGGLGVVDPAHPVDGAEVGDPVPVGLERAQAVPDGRRGDAVGPGECRGGQGVGHEVRGVRGQVADRAELRGAVLPLVDEGPVGEHVLHQADHPDPGRAEGEPDRAGALLDVGVADQLLGHRVGDVVDAGGADALVDAALVGGVVGHRGVPVEVVLGDVEHRGGLGGHRVRVVQLEAGQLDGVHVVGLGVHHGLDDGQTDVAARDAAATVRLEHGVEHLHGRGLAVGAGEAQPLPRVLRVAQPPGQLDLAPDRDPPGVRRRQGRRRRGHARRGDEEVHVVREGRRGAGADPHFCPEDLQQPRLLLLLRVGGLGQHRDVRADVGEVVRGGEARDADADDDGADALPGVRPAQVVEPHSGSPRRCERSEQRRVVFMLRSPTRRRRPPARWRRTGR